MQTASAVRVSMKKQTKADTPHNSRSRPVCRGLMGYYGADACRIRASGMSRDEGGEEIMYKRQGHARRKEMDD
eukprot:6111869-Pleurochrysis_carterae.AAC.1